MRDNKGFDNERTEDGNKSGGQREQRLKMHRGKKGIREVRNEESDVRIMD